MKGPPDKSQRREALQWPDGCNDLDVPKAKFGNTRAALQAAKIVVRFNNFRQQLTIEGHGLEGEASDHSVSVLRSRIYDAFGFNPNTDDTYQALIDIGRQHMFNPVVDWLNEQKWDGTKRAERLFVDYLGGGGYSIARRLRPQAAVRDGEARAGAGRQIRFHGHPRRSTGRGQIFVLR